MILITHIRSLSTPVYAADRMRIAIFYLQFVGGGCIRVDLRGLVELMADLWNRRRASLSWVSIRF
jgi:hypothetical protein